MPLFVLKFRNQKLESVSHPQEKLILADKSFKVHPRVNPAFREDELGDFHVISFIRGTTRHALIACKKGETFYQDFSWDPKKNHMDGIEFHQNIKRKDPYKDTFFTNMVLEGDEEDKL